MVTSAFVCLANQLSGQLVWLVSASQTLYCSHNCSTLISRTCQACEHCWPNLLYPVSNGLWLGLKVTPLAWKQIFWVLSFLTITLRVCVCVHACLCAEADMWDGYERGCIVIKQVVWAESVSVWQHEGVCLVLWTLRNKVSGSMSVQNSQTFMISCIVFVMYATFLTLFYFHLLLVWFIFAAYLVIFLFCVCIL